MIRPALGSALALLLCAAPAPAQRPPLSAPCDDAAPLLTTAERRYCFALAQTVESAQPLLGILIAQGNPTPGTAAAGGPLRLGGLPRGSATAQIGAVHVRLPDIRRQQTAATARLEAPAPSLSATATAELFPGFAAAPGFSGIASVVALGSVAWLPFRAADVPALAAETAEFAYGAGVRLGLLRESFVAPAASLSLMYRRLARVGYGDVCPAGAGADLITGTGQGYDFTAGTCAQRGDPGEFTFDLSSWSGRLVVSKRLLGLGLAAGAGYDRYRSDVGFGFGATPTIPGVGSQPVYIRGSGLLLEQQRGSAFLNAAFTVLITTVALEAGWLQGGRAVTGFEPTETGFEPRRGAAFGSLGVRAAF